ncbi:hypothetical protein [Fischerella thermalis]|jgi:hypothetical protein|uniref:hypothetical protein n=1 Tax=Fischerella thermalis TaxID=372787 RepID=UPI0021558A19|nr:hypothetical protein [Fischerella thermalis]
MAAIKQFLAATAISISTFSNKGLNNSNQIVFYAILADGTGGIFRADPESEPPTCIPEATPILGLLTVGVVGTTLGVVKRKSPVI